MWDKILETIGISKVDKVERTSDRIALNYLQSTEYIRMAEMIDNYADVDEDIELIIKSNGKKTKLYLQDKPLIVETLKAMGEYYKCQNDRLIQELKKD